MDAFVQRTPATGATKSVAPPTPDLEDSLPVYSAPETKEDQARAAWAAIAKPVTEETFVAWYCATHNKKPAKRAAGLVAGSAQPPSAKRQALLPGARQPVAAAAAAAPKALSTGKRNALFKSLTSSIKAAIKGKKAKWHAGDSETVSGSTICDPDEFAQLFPGVTMTKKGVTTSFFLATDELAAALGTPKITVPTWSTSSRAFAKAYKTGSESVSLVSAHGKYSTGTSTVTLKCNVRVGGQSDSYDFFGDLDLFGFP